MYFVSSLHSTISLIKNIILFRELRNIWSRVWTDLINTTLFCTKYKDLPVLPLLAPWVKRISIYISNSSLLRHLQKLCRLKYVRHHSTKRCPNFEWTFKNKLKSRYDWYENSDLQCNQISIYTDSSITETGICSEFFLMNLAF